MSIEIKLEHFEGPLDALLKLIDKNKIDIYNIPIAKLTDDYLNYIKNNDLTNNMNDISKFMLMASYLLEIKSKMLLPKEVDEVTKLEIDPREELMLKLLEYRKYKDVAEELSKIEVFTERVIFKSPEYNVLDDIITSGATYNKNSIEEEGEEVSSEAKEENIQELLNGLTLKDLYATFEKIVKRKESKKDKIRSEFKTVTKSLYSVNEKMTYIKDLIFLYDVVEFERVFEESACKQEVVVTFLAMLELIKTREIRVVQDENFSKILISLNKK